jgi:hypothetical protein
MTSILTFQIARIENRQFACFPEDYIVGENVDIHAQFGFDVDEQTQTVCCFSKFMFEQQRNKLLVAEVLTYFLIHPDSFEEIAHDGEFQIPVDHLRHFATIAVGTARGILWAKTEGTCLNQIVLPPINLVEAITDDFRKEATSNQNVAEP